MAPEDEKTLTIARRTIKNLKYVYSKKYLGEDVEEFTQLLNSMFGVLICLREDFIKGDQVQWDDILNLELKDKINNLDKIIGNDPTAKSPKLIKINSFSKLISNLRHAFAHNCFDLTIDENSREIKGIIVWNITDGQANNYLNRVWEAELNEDNLKHIAYLVLEYVERALGVA